jgi:2'-5' RNA ligase
MYFCVVHYPKIDTTKIEEIRQEYDPTHSLIKPHLTLVFPIKSTEVDFEMLKSHLTNIALNTKPFDLEIGGFEKSWDNWLFLGTKAGSRDINTLHDKLYSGILEPHWRKDLPFSPHISLGQFNQEGTNYNVEKPTQVAFDSQKYKEALTKAERLNLDFHTEVDKITLITLNDEISQVIDSVDFPFKNQ